VHLFVDYLDDAETHDRGSRVYP